jgi:hypothetical protein
MIVPLVVIAVPSILATLLLEVREGRMRPNIAGLDGGVSLCAGAVALHWAGVL